MALLPRPALQLVGFHAGYFGWALALLLAEVFIAGFVHDRFLRPHGGDFLAALLLYCLIRSFLALPARLAAGSALLIACLLEFLQYFQLLGHLGWQHSRVARLLLGSQFEWADMLAYTLGAALVLAIEGLRDARRNQPA